jgi:hypothetical protein
LNGNRKPSVGQLSVINQPVVEAGLHDGSLIWAGGHKLPVCYLDYKQEHRINKLILNCNLSSVANFF